jgi:hypothetical protein
MVLKIKGVVISGSKLPYVKREQAPALQKSTFSEKKPSGLVSERLSYCATKN